MRSRTWKRAGSITILAGMAVLVVSFASLGGVSGKSGGGDAKAKRSAPKASCGTGYKLVNKDVTDRGTSKLYASDTKVCGLFIKNVDVGKPSQMSVVLTAGGAAPVRDIGKFSYFAGPVYADKQPGQCTATVQGWLDGSDVADVAGSCTGKADTSNGGADDPTGTPGKITGRCGAGYTVYAHFKPNVAGTAKAGDTVLYYNRAKSRICLVHNKLKGYGTKGSTTASMRVFRPDGTQSPAEQSGNFKYYAGPVYLNLADKPWTGCKIEAFGYNNDVSTTPADHLLADGSGRLKCPNVG